MSLGLFEMKAALFLRPIFKRILIFNITLEISLNENYIGCFADVIELTNDNRMMYPKRDLDGIFKMNNDKNTIFGCMEFCANFVFAGVQNGWKIE